MEQTDLPEEIYDITAAGHLARAAFLIVARKAIPRIESLHDEFEAAKAKQEKLETG